MEVVIDANFGMALGSGSTETLLEFSDSAVRKLKALQLEEGKPELMLRVSVYGGGCSGMKYGMTFAEQKEPGDALMDDGKVKIVVDPVALGLCKQLDLDAAVRKAAEKKAKSKEAVPTSEERISLMTTDRSLMTPEEPAAHRLAEFQNFSMDDPRGDDAVAAAKIDPESLFNLPKAGKDDEDDEA